MKIKFTLRIGIFTKWKHKKDYNHPYFDVYMSKFELVIELPCKIEEIFELTINYKNYKNIFPNQIKDIEIIQDSENFKVTKESLMFKSIIQKEISQQSEHIIKKPEFIKSKIISGPLKNSTISMNFKNLQNSGTSILINGELKTSLKFKILLPIIKKYYKSILRALFYKMNSILMNS